jgi:hypothetical protein
VQHLIADVVIKVEADAHARACPVGRRPRFFFATTSLSCAALGRLPRALAKRLPVVAGAGW